jgi:hypothetical protein
MINKMSKRSATTAKKGKHQQVTFAQNQDDSEDDDDNDDDDDDGNEDDDDERDEEDDDMIPSSRNGTANNKGNHTINDDDGLELCNVPNFQLNFNVNDNDVGDNSRYELWTIRIPSTIDVQDLNKCTLQIPDVNEIPKNTSNESFNGTKDTFRSSKDGTIYRFQHGQPVENETFRLLLPKDGDNKQLIPAPIPFQKHWNVIMVPEMSTSMQQRHEQKQPAQKLRHAYAPVPQKTGLKRRWVPYGTTTVDTTASKISVGSKEIPYKSKASSYPGGEDLAHRHVNSTLTAVTTSNKRAVQLKQEDVVVDRIAPKVVVHAKIKHGVQEQESLIDYDEYNRDVETSKSNKKRKSNSSTKEAKKAEKKEKEKGRKHEKKRIKEEDE